MPQGKVDHLAVLLLMKGENMKFLKIALMSFFIVVMVAIVSRAEQEITSGTKVSMDYTLTVDGYVIDSSEGRGPLEYVQGQGMLIPGLEREIEGLKPGDKKSVNVSPQEAYGMPDPDAVIEVSRDQLPSDEEPQVGMILQTQTPEGQFLQGVVSEVNEEFVVIDFNHPLAGKILEFDISIISTE